MVPALLKRPRLTAFVLLLLGLFGWWNPLFPIAKSYLTQATTQSAETLTMMEELYLLAQAGASCEVPVLAGTFAGAAHTLEQLLSNLAKSSAALEINTLLLGITHSAPFLIALGVLWLLYWFKSLRTLALKFLLLGVFLNPGLSIATWAAHSLYESAQVTDPETLNRQLSYIHKDYLAKEEARKQKLEEHKQQQLAKDKADNHTGLTLGQRAEDALDKAGSTVAEATAEGFKELETTMKYVAKKLTVLVNNYLAYVIFMFVLLPLGYLGLGYRLLRSLFPTVPNIPAGVVPHIPEDKTTSSPKPKAETASSTEEKP